MKKIHKKLNQQFFDEIANGRKTFEFRVADFEAEPGDEIILEEYEYEKDGITAIAPTGRILKKRVGYVGKTKDFPWLSRPDVKSAADQNGFQIISLLDRNDLWEVSVKTVIFNPEKTKILMPFYDDGTYGAIGGHLEHGESFEDGLRREIKEETGIDFTGKLTEISTQKQEWTKPECGYQVHKIVIYYRLTLSEDVELTLEENGGEGTVSLDWVPLDDILFGKTPLLCREDNVEIIKKALKKEEK